MAAGTFKTLNDQMQGDLKCVPTADLQSQALNALTSLMLAQAQECVWHKATVGKKKK